MVSCDTEQEQVDATNELRYQIDLFENACKEEPESNNKSTKKKIKSTKLEKSVAGVINIIASIFKRL